MTSNNITHAPELVGQRGLDYLIDYFPRVLEKKGFSEGEKGHEVIKVNYFGHILGPFAYEIYGVRLVAGRETWNLAESLAEGRFMRTEDVFRNPFNRFNANLSGIKIAEYQTLDRVTFFIFDVERVIDKMVKYAQNVFKTNSPSIQNSLAFCSGVANYTQKRINTFDENFSKMMALIKEQQAET